MIFEENLFQKLGQITVYYSELEEGIEHLFAALINQPTKIAAIIIHRQPISQTINILEALFKEKIEDLVLLRRIENWVSATRKCINDRNLFVHSTWSIRDPEFSIRSKAKIKKEGFISSWSWANPEEVEGVAKSIESAALETYGILMDMESKGLTDYQNLPKDY